MPSSESAKRPTWQHNNFHNETRHAKEIIRERNLSANEQQLYESRLFTIANESTVFYTDRLQNIAGILYDGPNDGLVFKCLPPPNINGCNHEYYRWRDTEYTVSWRYVDSYFLFCSLRTPNCHISLLEIPSKPFYSFFHDHSAIKNE